jgi:hypothetical protein
MSKPNMHQSDVSMMLRCGFDYYLTRVMGKRKPPVVRMVEGTAVHKAGEFNLLSKIDSGALLPESDVLDIARDSLNEEWDVEGISLSGEEKAAGEKKVKGLATDAAIRMAQCEHRNLAPAIDPLYVERPFRLEHPSLPFNIQGTIDTQALVDGGTALRDRKTARVAPPNSRAHTSMQLTIYSLGLKTLDGVPPKEIYLDTIVDAKSGPRLVTHSTERTQEDYRMELDRMTLVYDAAAKGVFLPADPGDWKCSREYCRHWQDECPYGRRNRKRMDHIF